MAGNKQRIVIPGRLRLFLADGTATAPADATSEMPEGWFDVGLTDREGSSFATDPSFGSVESHQSDYPSRKYVESRTGRVECNLQEWSAQNMIAVHGGGEVTTVTPATNPPTYKFVPGDGVPDSLQACLQINDGSKAYRYIVPACSQAEGVEQDLAKTGASTLPLRLDVEGQDGVPPWYLLTNDPAFMPVEVTP